MLRENTLISILHLIRKILLYLKQDLVLVGSYDVEFGVFGSQCQGHPPLYMPRPIGGMLVANAGIHT